jgi:hypothetical protein
MNDVLVQLSGGLGNQLFQIANGYAYCKRFGYELKITRNTNCKRGNYWDTFLKNKIHPDTVIDSDSTASLVAYKEPHFHYTPIPENKRYLCGYFQSSKYFKDYENEIKKLFSEPEQEQPPFPEEYVMIHIRLTDYYASDYIIGFHVVATSEYYKKAIEEIKKIHPNPDSIKFLVFSDDIKACVDFLPKNCCIFVQEPDESKALVMMTRFQYYIIANSSFSWWAAYLSKNKKKVFAPNRWFGRLGPSDFQDIYEPDWELVVV